VLAPKIIFLLISILVKVLHCLHLVDIFSEDECKGLLFEFLLVERSVFLQRINNSIKVTFL